MIKIEVECSVAAEKQRDLHGEVTAGAQETAAGDVELPVQPADEANSAMVLLAREKRRRALRYTAGGAAFVGVLIAIYHATSHHGTSTVAGLLAPAAIMVLYLLWVLYTTRASRHAARVAAAAAAAAAASADPAEEAPALTCSPAETSLDQETQTLTRAHSKLVLNKELSPKTIPNRLRSSALHHSTESLHRLGNPRTLNNCAPVHRSTLNLASRGSPTVPQHGHRHAGRAHRSSNLQLNNMRHVAAAAANLPSYEEATNRNHWLLTHNHSRERLLKQ